MEKKYTDGDMMVDKTFAKKLGIKKNQLIVCLKREKPRLIQKHGSVNLSGFEQKDFRHLIYPRLKPQ